MSVVKITVGSQQFGVSKENLLKFENIVYKNTDHMEIDVPENIKKGLLREIMVGNEIKDTRPETLIEVEKCKDFLGMDLDLNTLISLYNEHHFPITKELILKHFCHDIQLYQKYPNLKNKETKAVFKYGGENVYLYLYIHADLGKGLELIKKISCSEVSLGKVSKYPWFFQVTNLGHVSFYNPKGLTHIKIVADPDDNSEYVISSDWTKLIRLDNDGNTLWHTEIGELKPVKTIVGTIHDQRDVEKLFYKLNPEKSYRMMIYPNGYLILNNSSEIYVWNVANLDAAPTIIKLDLINYLCFPGCKSYGQGEEGCRDSECAYYFNWLDNQQCPSDLCHYHARGIIKLRVQNDLISFVVREKLFKYNIKTLNHEISDYDEKIHGKYTEEGDDEDSCMIGL